MNPIDLKTKWGDIIQQPILHIDGTPDEGYPLRILEAYRENCNCKWSDNTSREEPMNPLLKMMNEHCEQRALLLDKAIAKLRR